MGLISPTLPTLGQPNSTEDVDILDALTQLVNLVNGQLDGANLVAGLRADIGSSADRRRSSNMVTAAEARTSASFGLLTTPDRVSGIVLSTDGLMFIAYQALWKESVTNTGRAAVFVGANQLKKADGSGGAPQVVESGPFNRATANRYAPLSSYPEGLHTPTQDGAADATSAVTTGQIIGHDNAASGDEAGSGIICIFAAAGTYDVSVQFRAVSGTVTVKERKLWVWTRSS